MERTLRTTSAIALGGAVGSLTRYGLAVVSAPTTAVLLCNLVGSIVVGYAARQPGDPTPLRQGLMVGFCGGLTTMSAWAVLTADEWLNGDPVEALVDAAVMITVVLAGVTLGSRASLWS